MWHYIRNRLKSTNRVKIIIINFYKKNYAYPFDNYLYCIWCVSSCRIVSMKYSNRPDIKNTIKFTIIQIITTSFGIKFCWEDSCNKNSLWIQQSIVKLIISNQGTLFYSYLIKKILYIIHYQTDSTQ